MGLLIAADPWKLILAIWLLALTQGTESTSLASPSAGSLQNFEKARVIGVPGEATHLYLYPEGFYIHPQYNDVTGDTDKLLTASMKVGYLGRFQDLRIESTYFWRLLTPAFQSSTDRDLLEKPVGLYADWMEWSNAIAKPYYWQGQIVKPQITIGFNHIGGKGGRKLHRWVHKVTRNPLTGLEYTDQPDGYFMRTGMNLTHARTIWREGLQSASMGMTIGAEVSKMMREAYVDVTNILTLRKDWWEISINIKLVRQFDSQVYEGIRPHRYELAAGTVIYGVFTPTLKYISSYLEGDNVGQTYFDFVHFNFRF